MRKQPYTVILQTPDHVDSCRPVYIFKIAATDPELAVLEARKDALNNAELSDDKADDNYCNPYDYLVIAVFVGHHLNVNPEA